MAKGTSGKTVIVVLELHTGKPIKLLRDKKWWNSFLAPIARVEQASAQVAQAIRVPEEGEK